MQDIRVPVKVRPVGQTKASLPHNPGTTSVSLHHETSRFVVDLRARIPEKTFEATVAHKAPQPWQLHLETSKAAKVPPIKHNKAVPKKAKKNQKAPAPTKPVRQLELTLPGRKRRLTLGFVISAVLVALIVPTLAKVGAVQVALVGYGVAAAHNLANAGAALKAVIEPNTDNAAEQNVLRANNEFVAAYQNFLSAQASLKQLGDSTLTLLAAVPGLGSRVETGGALLDLGKNIATMGQSFSKAILAFDGWQFDHLFDGAVPLTTRLQRAQGDLDLALQSGIAATINLKKLDSASLPNSIAAQVLAIQAQLPALKTAAQDAQGFVGFLLGVLGQDNPKKYVVLFQNNAEIRPTGGFIGSYGRLDLYKGRVDQFYIDDVYNIDGQLKTSVVPPRPLQKITGAWSFHDANWYFDFASSAQNLNWFYQETGHASLDGIMAITPLVLEKILSVLGPIAVPEHNVTFNAQNVVDILQYKVERDFDKNLNQPKTVVADLAAHIIEKLKALPTDKWPELGGVMLAALAEKDIQFWFESPELQNFVKSQGWSGEVRAAPQDYLAIVNTNLNGYKTDRVVVQAVDHEVTIDENGKAVVAVTVTRTHTGGQSSFDWYNRVNSDYLRVYVPKGAELLEARGHAKENYQAPLDYDALGFSYSRQVLETEKGLILDPGGTQIFEEAGKTVFGNWVYVSPGHTTTVVYRYRLPFQLDPQHGGTYSLVVQKQAGMPATRFRSQVTLPTGWRTTWHTKPNLRERVDGWRFDTNLKQDEFYGLTFSQ